MYHYKMKKHCYEKWKGGIHLYIWMQSMQKKHWNKQAKLVLSFNHKTGHQSVLGTFHILWLKLTTINVHEVFKISAYKVFFLFFEFCCCCFVQFEYIYIFDSKKENIFDRFVTKYLNNKYTYMHQYMFLEIRHK